MRFYRALLHLYPAGFLADYRAELCAAFAERMREHTGPLGPLWIALAALADVVPNALAVHREMLWQDLRYAARTLGRTPGFAVTAIVLVALGVGANTAAFSLADFVLVRPLPYPRADRLVKVWQGSPGGGRNELSPANYRDWAAATTSVFAAFGAYAPGAMNLVGATEPRRLEVARVTPNLLRIVGVPALVGRVITPADSAAGGVVVLSYALWQTEFGGASDIVGRVVRLDGTAHTVVGVMPPSFRFPHREIAAWTPLVFREDDFTDRGDTYIEGVARLRDGVSFVQARDQLALVSSRIEHPYAKDNGEVVGAMLGLRDELSQRARLLVLALCGAALCILLLACANLASLLLARAGHRARELAVRAALGGAQQRIVRQLATESVGLAVVGGCFGVAMAALGVPLLAHLVPSGLPIAERPSVDGRVLAIAVVVVGLTGLLFGVMPGVRAGGRGMFAALRDGGRTGGGRTQRLRATLVVVEVAASVVLLVSSGLLIRAVWRIQGTDPGFRADSVLTLRTALPLPKYGATARRAQFYARVLQEVRALPGVRSAAYSTGIPMRMTGGIWAVTRPGEPDPHDGSRMASLRFVTPQYFATLGIPLRRGRDVAETDTYAQPPIAVVSDALAQRYWPNDDAIGKRVVIAGTERTVVGVVGDVRVRGREGRSEPQIYLSSQQVEDDAIIGYTPKDLVVRATVPAATLLPAIRRAVRAADPDQPISDVAAMADVVGAETAPRVTQLRLLALLSAVALLIAGVGIHGLLTFTVSRRSQELAVRRALGAEGRGIVRLVLGEGLVLALTGIVVGVSLAYPAARAMGALLAGVEPADPLTLGVVSALCLVTAVVGCVRPAMRAVHVAPLAALRAE